MHFEGKETKLEVETEIGWGVEVNKCLQKKLKTFLKLSHIKHIL